MSSMRRWDLGRNKLAAMVSSEDGSAAGKGNMLGEGRDGKRESILTLVTSRLQNLARSSGRSRS